MPPIPLYEGTRPYQTIPFQWSLHTVTDDGDLRHREFLADADDDPRRRFAETLIEALRAFDGPIIVYSRYEQNEAERVSPRISRPRRAAQCHHRPPGGLAAGRAQRRLLSGIRLQQLDQVRCPGPLSRFRL